MNMPRERRRRHGVVGVATSGKPRDGCCYNGIVDASTTRRAKRSSSAVEGSFDKPAKRVKHQRNLLKPKTKKRSYSNSWAVDLTPAFPKARYLALVTKEKKRGRRWANNKKHLNKLHPTLHKPGDPESWGTDPIPKRSRKQETTGYAASQRNEAKALGLPIPDDRDIRASRSVKARNKQHVPSETNTRGWVNCASMRIWIELLLKSDPNGISAVLTDLLDEAEANGGYFKNDMVGSIS